METTETRVVRTDDIDDLVELADRLGEDRHEWSAYQRRQFRIAIARDEPIDWAGGRR